MATTNADPLWQEPGIRFGLANTAVILSLEACAVLGAPALQTLHDLDLSRLALLVGVSAITACLDVRRTSPRPVNSGGFSWQTLSSSR